MTSLLESIQRGRQSKPPRVLLYGVEGIGKSTFGSEAPKPIFIQTEDGLDEINSSRQIPRRHYRQRNETDQVGKTLQRSLLQSRETFLTRNPDIPVLRVDYGELLKTPAMVIQGIIEFIQQHLVTQSACKTKRKGYRKYIYFYGTLFDFLPDNILLSRIHLPSEHKRFRN